MNIGTIVEADMLKVRLVRSRAAKGGGYSGPIARGGKLLGQVEEYFIETLTPGDTFVFAGEILRYEAVVEDKVYVSRSHATESRKSRPMKAANFRSRPIWRTACAKYSPEHKAMETCCPARSATGSTSRNARSMIPKAGELLVETFPRGDKFYLVCYSVRGPARRTARSACC